MPANRIFDGPVTNLLSVLCILIEIIPCAHVKGWVLTILNLALSLVIFQVIGAASMAVKGLTLLLPCLPHCLSCMSMLKGLPPKCTVWKVDL